MCGIIGCIGSKSASGIILSGLKKLEYRGYDSAGIVTVHKRRMRIVKCKGRVNDLESLLESRRLKGSVGLGHTRWATHGKPSRLNAHPHPDSRCRLAVVHNGIIENFSKIKKDLKKSGIRFRSETDSELVAHLISKFYRGCLEKAVREAVQRLEGSYALGVISLSEPGKIVAVRRDSSLVIGLGRNENYITSDVSAILEQTRRVIYLKDDEIAVVTKDGVNISDLKGNRVFRAVDNLTYSRETVQKEGFSHFMLKEIHEQPRILSGILARYLVPNVGVRFEKFGLSSTFLKKINNIVILACGTAYHAGLIGKYALEAFTRIPVGVDLGSEFRYRRPVIDVNTLVIAISQSGETADTLAAVREARKNRAKVVAVCNVLGSALTRESDAVIYAHAGPEISVASTKAYTAQVMVLYLFGLYLAGLKRTLSKKNQQSLLASLKTVPVKQKEILKTTRRIKSIARKHLHFGAFLYLGRNINFPTALEGALKLKEISYIPAEGYPAGEMKHGPIALIDEYRAVVCIANTSFVLEKMVSNIQEILARQGKVIAVATSGNKQIEDYVKEVIFVPPIREEFSPLLTIVPLQLFAYYIALLKGYDVDKPRNLAKSVTVE